MSIWPVGLLHCAPTPLPEKFPNLTEKFLKQFGIRQPPLSEKYPNTNRTKSSLKSLDSDMTPTPIS